jgi:hypothetical protein
MRFWTIAAGLVFAAVPTIASAHGDVPFTAPNTIHGCRNQNTGVLRQISTGICSNGEAVVHWNIVGPAGTPGASGTNGINGTNGIDGTNGTNGIDGTSATRPDGPCVDYFNRYVNCGNGTVTDTVTGLIWLQAADCLGAGDWVAAVGAAAALANGQCGLTDDSSAGDWRLPTRDEWIATMARAVDLGCYYGGSGTPPSLTNDAGSGCFFIRGGSSFTGVNDLERYWSSTSSASFSPAASSAHLEDGSVDNPFKSLLFLVWPVRGGSR